jgi:CBS domain-containing membrane protein
MTTPLFAVGPEAPLLVLQGLMAAERIRHVPVVDSEGELVGLVSERDLMERAYLVSDDLPWPARLDLLAQMRASDVMTRDVETVDVDDDLAAAARMMLDNRYGCLPVSNHGVLTGIVTEADFVRFLAKGNEAPAPARPARRQPANRRRTSRAPKAKHAGRRGRRQAAGRAKPRH